jgi:tetratricopeptide (TPR) repeat protein
VRKAGNRLRITAQLIKIADGYHLWSERFDRELTDVFEIQDEIALAIVDKLKIELLAKEKAALQKRGTDNLEAYQFYLKGRHYLNNRPKGFFEKAKQNFLEAIALDANFALPYAGLAQLYVIIGVYEFIAPASAFAEARKRVEQALQLDNDLAEAHMLVGAIKLFYDRDYDGAEQAFTHALALNAGYAYGRSYYAILLCSLGRTDEAQAEAQLAKNSDPLSPAIIALAGLISYFSQKYDHAIEECKKALEIEPANFVGLWISGIAHTLTGRHKTAIELGEKLARITDRAPLFAGFLGFSQAVAGNKAEAEKLLAELHKRSKKEYVSPLSLAYIYTGLKDKDRTFEWLDKAYEVNSPTMAVLNRHPVFDYLRSDKRFAALLQKVGLEA